MAGSGDGHRLGLERIQEAEGCNEVFDGGWTERADEERQALSACMLVSVPLLLRLTQHHPHHRHPPALHPRLPLESKQTLDPLL